MAELLADFLQMMTSVDRLPDRMPDPPPPEQWLPLYRQHRRIMDELGSWFGLPNVGQMSASKLMDGLRQFIRLDAQTRLESLKQLPPEQLMLMAKMFLPMNGRNNQDWFKRLVDNDRAHDDATMERLVATPEYQFFFRVGLPCWALYKQYPITLLRRARRGDVGALDDLLRLDKSVLAIPEIGAIWHAAAHDRSRARHKRLLAALNGKPRGGITRKKLKEAMAGLVWQLAKAGKVNITEPEIRALFHGVARIRHNQIDTDLPGNHAFAKAIQRNRLYPSLPKSDKSRP